MLWKSILLSACGISAVSAGLQTTFSKPEPTDQQWLKTLRNDEFEGYSVRIKQPSFCDDVVQYSGYLDIEETDDHFFFWFFESRFQSVSSETVLWLNGGPGCSSLTGLWMEHGPCLVSAAGNETFYNPYSWNNFANMIFLDQPIQVGYSYGSSRVGTSEQSAKATYAFLALFFEEFPQYAEKYFHISGESYGECVKQHTGHYLPALGREIVRRQQSSSPPNFNLDSVLIGNGWTNPLIQSEKYIDFGCDEVNAFSESPVFEEDTCDSMKKALPRCKRLSKFCYDHPSTLACMPAQVGCAPLEAPCGQNGRNPYDIRKKCDEGNSLCYDVLSGLEIWANRPDVRAELGVDDAVEKYESCQNQVGFRFGLTADNPKNFAPHVTEILAAGVRVLIYAGDKDCICNWYLVGNKAWTLELDWTGKKGFQEAEDEEWFSWITQEPAGELRKYGNLTFLRVYDAGHMVPYDQPENSLDFFSRWIKDVLY
ncbi:peptidase S10, serine carboxypeptidase [Umbelopsis sp. PMI_123]|nr:peptidase S10, serine carboxypeptidase [Umbelopsis sp. PMI_123]